MSSTDILAEHSRVIRYPSGASGSRSDLVLLGGALGLIGLSVLAHWRRLGWAALLLRVQALVLLSAATLEKRRRAAREQASPQQADAGMMSRVKSVLGKA